MQRRDFIASVGAGLALAPTAGWSQDAYPARPVKLIVPFPPGGPTDIMGRTAANMGVAYSDIDGDGLGDVFVTHLAEEFHGLFRQDRRHRAGHRRCDARPR